MKYENLKKIIDQSDKIIFFGGAGVSTESNIPDFRSEDGLYKSKNEFYYSPEVMLSHSFFMTHTEEFFEFYRKKVLFPNATPNYAHIALAQLEKEQKLKGIITQNIDGLHQKAGSSNVQELHGSIHRNYCSKCSKFYDVNFIINSPTTIPYCEVCGGIIKPDVVLYEESLDNQIIKNSIALINFADTLIIGGTSLVVYPAAGLIQYFRGNNLVLINKSTTKYDTMANLVINDSIGKVFNDIMN